MERIVVEFDFNLYGKDKNGTEHVDYSIWYTNSDPHSIRLLRHLGVLMYQLTDLATFTPGIITYDCNKIGCNQKFKNKNCVSDGKYCSIAAEMNEKELKAGVSGREQVMEDLREYCVYDTFKSMDMKGEVILFEYV